MNNNFKILYPLQPSFIDYPTKEDLALSLCFIGCDHNCKGCQNYKMQDHNYDTSVLIFDNDNELFNNIKKFIDSVIIDNLKKYKTNKLVLTGGDPLSKINIIYTKILLDILSEYNVDICVYTGFNISEVKKMNINTTSIKFFKCGKFDQDKKRNSYKNDDEMVLASPNQNFYNNEYNKISDNGIIKFN